MHPGMTTIAVVAHSGKTLGGGLVELRELLAREGFADPVWYEVSKSRKAPRRARQAVEQGADLLLVWGGDGMVQRCADAVANSGVALGVLPAGTANLLATNLGIPMDLEEALQVGLHGTRRALDSGTVNGEHFVVMAGSGFDARMIAESSRSLKDNLGRLAYVWTGLRALSRPPTTCRVEVDGRLYLQGKVSMLLVGNVGRLFGGVTVFEKARPDDGVLEVAVVTAAGRAQWARAVARVAAGHAEKSPYVHLTSGRRIRVDLAKAVPYELDGGERPATKKLRIKVRPSSVTVCVPGDGPVGPAG
jgi:YegS/Rv2252/BmrU family lipid kinase